MQNLHFTTVAILDPCTQWF